MDRPTRRILLATDLGPASRPAVEAALDLAAREVAELLVLSVIDPGRRDWSHGGRHPRVDEVRTILQDRATEVVAAARARGLRATFLVWEGDPAEVILEAANAEAVDVVVIGSRGFGPVRRRLLGSVSSRVSDAASCRVVVVAQP